MASVMEISRRAVGWGFLGCGPISATVASEVNRFGGGRLVAACGRDLDRTRSFAETHGFEQAYTQTSALLEDPRVDAVYVALPHSLHVEAILAALAAGKHVLCEKPLAMTVQEVELVRSHPRSSALVVAEGFMMRHHPQWTWVMETIANGRIGAVRGLHAHSCLRLPGPAPEQNLPGQGSVLLDIGCYSVHLARTICGSDPMRVFARMEYAPGTNRDISISAHLSFQDSSAQLFAASALQPARRIHILGTEGTIELHNPIHSAPDGTASISISARDGSSERKVFPWAPQYALQFQDVCRAITEGSKSLVGLDDSLANAKVLDAIRASAATGEIARLR